MSARPPHIRGKTKVPPGGPAGRDRGGAQGGTMARTGWTAALLLLAALVLNAGLPEEVGISVWREFVAKLKDNRLTEQDIVTERGTSSLELANLVTSGTSGGGVFWNGYHIANTWYQAYVFAENGVTISRHFSAAALNSSQVAARFE